MAEAIGLRDAFTSARVLIADGLGFIGPAMAQLLAPLGASMLLHLEDG
jgi:hypothetical protein